MTWINFIPAQDIMTIFMPSLNVPNEASCPEITSKYALEYMQDFLLFPYADKKQTVHNTKVIS